MTICIAAICEGGEKIVVTADRMFTVAHPLNVEFEPPISKIERMTKRCVALAAGSTLYAAEIIDEMDRLHGASIQESRPNMDEVKKVYEQHEHERPANS